MVNPLLLVSFSFWYKKEFLWSVTGKNTEKKNLYTECEQFEMTDVKLSTCTKRNFNMHCYPLSHKWNYQIRRWIVTLFYVLVNDFNVGGITFRLDVSKCKQLVVCFFLNEDILNIYL